MRRSLKEWSHLLCEVVISQQHSTSKIVPQRMPGAFLYETFVSQAGSLQLSIKLCQKPVCA